MHCVLLCVWLLWLHSTSVRLIQVGVETAPGHRSLCRLEFPRLGTACAHCPVVGYVGCFQLGAVTDSARILEQDCW